MTYSSRLWLYAPFVLVLILAAWVISQWWLAAGALEKDLAALKGRPVMPGISMDWTSVAVGGFPFRVDASFNGLQIKGEGAHGPFAWSSEKFALHALIYGRNKTVYEAAGRQQLSWTDRAGKPQAIQFQHGSLHASSVTDAAGLARFDLDIVNVASARVTAGRFQFHLRRDGDDLNLMVRADSVNGFGKPRKLIKAYAALNKGSTLAPLLRGDMPWPMAVVVWKGFGGRAALSQTVEPELATQVLSPLY
ncbi:MAG: hypothetical protein RL274_395 [Pseudomonadota bacterium]|jgi:hypothetical protein